MGFKVIVNCEGFVYYGIQGRRTNRVWLTSDVSKASNYPNETDAKVLAVKIENMNKIVSWETRKTIEGVFVTEVKKMWW